MATANAKRLEQFINQLIKDRQQHLDAMAKIDAALARVAVQPRKAAAKRITNRNGRQAGKATDPVTANGRHQASPKAKRPARKRQTAEQWLLGRLRDAKPLRTGEINAAWKRSGRPGAANHALAKLVKAGKLQRTPIEGGRGSQYSLA